MFKTLNIYRQTAPITLESADAMQALQFVPCGPTQDKSVGWVPPRGEEHGALVESIDGHLILKLRIETKSVPASMVNEKTKEEAAHIEATTGRKPGKKETKALREDALLALLPQAFPKNTSVLVWFDTAAGLVMTDASSQGMIDDVVTALIRTFDGLALQNLQTATSPLTAMTQWLSSQDVADNLYVDQGFIIERACELRSGDEEKSVVKFTRHNVQNDQVRQHISEGKLPKWTAMSYDDRISFVLTDNLQIKKIEFLEGVFDGRAEDSVDGFDADVALATGELGMLVPALVEALGGEMVLTGAPGTQAAESGVTVTMRGNAGPAIYTDGQPDPLLEQARDLVIKSRNASTSYVQRQLKIGYNRAARLLEDLETMGVVGPMKASGMRDVLEGAAA